MALKRFVLIPVVAVGVGFNTTCGHFHASSIAEAQDASDDVMGPFEAEDGVTFAVERVAGGLEHPWGLAFLPDGRMLVTERPGRLRIVEADGSVVEDPVAGVPTAFARGQGGLLDIALDPDFADNRRVYLSYSALTDEGASTHVSRGRLEDGSLEDVEVIFASNGTSTTGRHFGSRLVFDDEGHLYITHGDRGVRANGQDPSNHAGATLRINPDGSVPEDNPFLDRDGYMPELFTIGNRNAQGMAIHPETGRIWQHEHGPRGGDELNIIEAGANYGWPEVSLGAEYTTGRPVAPDSKPGMVDPIHHWTPSIAPSGMAFYTGDVFPEWRGDLFVGALAFRLLARLELDGEAVTHEERLLEDTLGRIRDVAQGPDGRLYLLTDESDGGIYRLVPAD